MDCSICIEYTNTINIALCKFCNFSCCIKCFKKYILDTKKTVKNCMSCNKNFTRAMLVDILGMPYIEKLYKDHIKELLFSEEKTYIPISMIVVDKNKKIKKLKDEYEKLLSKYKLEIENTTEKTLDHFKDYYEIKALEDYIRYLKSKPLEKEKRNQYKYPCATINCEGFVNNVWHCELCDYTTCKNCFKIVNDNHECLKDDIDTALLIKKDSKPCPKCNISIMKTSGCDQMWCTSCHTTFDWKTLKIITRGIIHNPEYFRYMRDNNLKIERNPNDNPCENELYGKYIELINLKNISKFYDMTLINELYEIYRRIQHCELITLVNLNNKLDSYDEWRNSERVRFLEKEISEKQYKINLARKFKENDFLKEFISIQSTIYYTCKETYIKIIDDIIKTTVNKVKLDNKINEIIELNKLKEFCLELQTIELTKIKSVYNKNTAFVYKLYMPCKF